MLVRLRLLRFATTLAVVILHVSAAAVVALRPRAAEVTCEAACGSTDEWCAQGARDKLLAYASCLNNRGRKFVFRGGLLSARWKDTYCVAAFVTAEKHDVLVECALLEDKFSNIINRCFVDRDSGRGSDYLPMNPVFWYFGINTCDGRRLAASAADARPDPVVAAAEDLRVDESRGFHPVAEDDEERQIIDFLLGRPTGVTGADVFNFPYSGAPARSVCQMAARKPRLRELYGGCE